MLKRCKQFFAALTAAISPADENFIAANLSRVEARLFWNMSIEDQYHSLKVAYSALNLSKDYQNADLKALVKSALLHDVGRAKSDVSVIDKVITVLLNKYVPRQMVKWGRFGRGGKLANLRHAIYIYNNHPERSALLLKKCASSPKVINIVKEHHNFPKPDDPLELIILRLADNLN